MSASVVRVAVLISGNGSNLQALIDAQASGTLEKVKFVRVISDRRAAKGLERAARVSIPTHYHGIVPYNNKFADDKDAARSAYDADLADLILADEPQLIVMAGYMRIVTPAFLDPCSKIPILNLHPALPGQFSGANAIARAHTAWLNGQITSTGVMIHRVIQEVDMGAPVLTEEIVFQKGMDEDISKFEDKVHEVEHRVIVEAVSMVVSDIVSSTQHHSS